MKKRFVDSPIASNDSIEKEFTTFRSKLSKRKSKGLKSRDSYSGVKTSLFKKVFKIKQKKRSSCLLYTSPSPRDLSTSRMPSSA